MQTTAHFTSPCRRTDSARTAQRLQAIQEHACRLVIERGYDGFTMDELAGAVGVSRRTLFNYVPDKPSAVLGIREPEEHDAMTSFLAGGPTGSLRADLVDAIDRIISDTNAPMQSVDLHVLVEQAIATDPKVTHLAMERFTELSRRLTTMICERQGWPPEDLRAQTISASFLALIKLAFEQFTVRGGDVEFRTLFHEVLDADLAARSIS